MMNQHMLVRVPVCTMQQEECSLSEHMFNLLPCLLQ